MSDTIVETVPNYSFEYWLKTAVIRATDSKYNAAVCYPCAATISAPVGKLDTVLESHHAKCHSAVTGMFWCTKCKCGAGMIKQGEQVKREHESTKEHARQAAKEVCITCATVNPPSGHGGAKKNKTAHNIVSFSHVQKNVARAEQQAGDEDLLAFAQHARKVKGTLNGVETQMLAVNFPCVNHISNKIIKKDGHNGVYIRNSDPAAKCNVCRLSGKGKESCGDALTVIFPKPARFQQSKASGPAKEITKQEWKALDDDLQDCYTLKGGKAFLDSEAYEQYIREGAKPPTPEEAEESDDDFKDAETADAAGEDPIF